MRFDAGGNVVDAYSILTGSLSNCAGGLTPWGTWLSCEEWESEGVLTGYSAGLVWECDPTGAHAAPSPRPSLGRFKHEMAACDPVREQIYLTEDQPDGLIYRYTPPAGTWGSGRRPRGRHARGDARRPGRRRPRGSAVPTSPTRPPDSGRCARRWPGRRRSTAARAASTTTGRVYITTKGDDRVWVHDIVAQTMTVLYDAADSPAPVLNGVDNIAVSAAHDLYVAEDGGNLEVCAITPDGRGGRRRADDRRRSTGSTRGTPHPARCPR